MPSLYPRHMTLSNECASFAARAGRGARLRTGSASTRSTTAPRRSMWGGLTPHGRCDAIPGGCGLLGNGTGGSGLLAPLAEDIPGCRVAARCCLAIPPEGFFWIGLDPPAVAVTLAELELGV